MSNNRYSPVDEIPKRKEGGLDSPDHGTNNDEADIQVFGYPREQVLL